MGLALFKERRISERRKLTGLLPGRLVFKASNLDIRCRPIDVSSHGLGIVLAEELQPGTRLSLLIPGRPIELEIAWSQPDFGKQDMHRYGLVTIDSSVDLEKEFALAGCLK